MNISPLQMILAFAGGFGVGLFFFLGLRLTLRLVQTVRRPVLLILASFFLRAAVAAGLFILIGGGELARFGLALLGFIVARFVTVMFCAGPRSASADAGKGVT